MAYAISQPPRPDERTVGIVMGQPPEYDVFRLRAGHAERL